MTTHILYDERAACGANKQILDPDDWPEPHQYVRYEKLEWRGALERVTCSRCLEELTHYCNQCNAVTMVVR